MIVIKALEFIIENILFVVIGICAINYTLDVARKYKMSHNKG